MIDEINRHYAMLHKEEDIKKINNAINSAIIFLSLNNDLANSAMGEVVALLQKADLYNGEIKRYGNKALQAYKNYENNLKFGNRKTYNNLLSCSDEMFDVVKNDVDKLLFAFKNYLDKKNVSNSNILAQLQLSNTLIERCLVCYNAYFKNVKANIKYDIEPYIPNMKLNGVYYWWNKMYDKVNDILNNSDDEIVFNDDANCSLAYEILDRKMCDYEVLRDTCVKGVENNTYN